MSDTAEHTAMLEFTRLIAQGPEATYPTTAQFCAAYCEYFKVRSVPFMAVKAWRLSSGVQH